jgi:hypothetical protein
VAKRTGQGHKGRNKVNKTIARQSAIVTRRKRQAAPSGARLPRRRRRSGTSWRASALLLFLVVWLENIHMSGDGVAISTRAVLPSWSGCTIAQGKNRQKPAAEAQLDDDVENPGLRLTLEVRFGGLLIDIWRAPWFSLPRGSGV